MIETGKPLEKLYETGCRPDQALTLIAFWERFPGRWSVGKLRRRLINLRPGQSAEDLTYWPPDDEGWQRESESKTDRLSLTGEEIRELIAWVLSRDLSDDFRARWEQLAEIAEKAEFGWEADMLSIHRKALESALRKRQEVLTATDCHG